MSSKSSRPAAGLPQFPHNMAIWHSPSRTSNASAAGASPFRSALSSPIAPPSTGSSSPSLGRKMEIMARHAVSSLTLSNSDRCAVRSFHNILLRFHRLVGIDNTSVPLAVYDDGPSTYFIHRTVLTRVLRTIAQATYDVTDSELKKHYNFAPHSFRVGACVLLHASGATASQIKHPLRWKSDSFMTSLRNVNALAEVQNLAFSTSAFSLPNII